jgi:hypothetical protein
VAPRPEGSTRVGQAGPSGYFAWIYIVLALALVAREWRALLEHARFGLLNRS